MVLLTTSVHVLYRYNTDDLLIIFLTFPLHVGNISQIK